MTKGCESRCALSLSRRSSNLRNRNTMKIIYAILTMTVLGLVQSSHASALSGPILDSANGHFYYLLASDTWSNSEAQAVALGGHLVTINDSAEETFVYNTFSAYGGVNRTLWIGLSDPTHTGNYVWSSGDPVTYTDWSPGEPNDYAGLEHYATIFPPNDPRANSWNDIQNSGYGGDGTFVGPYGVVEVVPEPTSAVLLLVGIVYWKRRTASTC